MLRRLELPVCLGFLCENASTAEGRAEFRFLRELSELTEADTPIHWFLPPGVFESHDRGGHADLVRVLRDRLSHGADRLVAMGYRAALHPLLARREVERDLSWGTKDPWKSGIGQVLGQSPTAVYPPTPDFGRPGMLRLYLEAGFEEIGIRFRSELWKRYSLLWREPESRVRLFTVLQASRDTLSELQRAETRLDGHRGAIILFDAPFVRRGGVKPFLRRLDRRYAVRVCGLRDLSAPPAPVTVRELAAMSAASLPCTPASRALWLTAEPLRRSSRRADARGLLELYARSAPAVEPAAAAVEEPRLREQSSEMSGNVTLPGPRFSARFRDGVLTGLERGGASLFPLGPLLCYVQNALGVHAASTESSTSFSAELERGLRAVLKAPGMTVAIDYRFAGSFGGLFVDVSASYAPAVASPRAVVPFGLALDLRDAGGPVSVRADSDSGPQEWPVDASEPPGRVRTVAGTAFALKAGERELSLSFPPRCGLEFRPLQWSIVERGRSRYLLLNPLGSFIPQEAREYPGIAERLTLILSAGAPPRRIPPAVARLVLPHRVLRTPAP